MIVFARGYGEEPGDMAAATGADAVGVDWPWTREPSGEGSAAAASGNLDPFALGGGGRRCVGGLRG